MEKLEQALVLLAEALEAIPNDRKTCPHCGFVEFVSWENKRNRDELKGAITRIKRVLEREEFGKTARNQIDNS